MERLQSSKSAWSRMCGIFQQNEELLEWVNRQPLTEVNPDNCLSALPPDVDGRGQPAPVRSWLVEGRGRRSA